jgi:xanthine/CO dehydrogenase XdhC/CoxF family maturation factor
VDDENGSFDDPLSWGLGLGCNGIVDVLLERLTPDAPACPVAFIAACLSRRRPGCIATVIASDNPEQIGQRVLWHAGESTFAACTVTDPAFAAEISEAVRAAIVAERPSQTLRFGAREVFLETIVPPTPLIICGANHDAAPLARMAKAVGWQVTVVDPWVGSPPRPERFPGADTVLCCAPADLSTRLTIEAGSFAVVMSHNVAHDAAFLAALLPAPVAYIGLLGPRRRTERLLEALVEQGTDIAADDHRLHGPIGLDIGAEDPDAIALSILAEMQAVKSGRRGGFLRESPRPIHDSGPVPPRSAGAR